MIKKVPFIIILLVIGSCNTGSDKRISFEEKKILEFKQIKYALDSIIKLVVEEYYPIAEAEGKNSIDFVMGKRKYKRSNIISDPTISSLIKKSGDEIVFISFEKTFRCLGNFKYDRARFEIKKSGLKDQYYYIYDFCPLLDGSKTIDNKNFKSVPLEESWYLEVEKN